MVIKSENDFRYLTECPACLSQSIIFYRKATFDFYRLKENQIKITDSEYGKIWNLSKCQNCGHIFANPCPSNKLINSLYSQVVDPLYEEEAEGRSKNFISILNFLGKVHPTERFLFDVGSATGILLNNARQRGWQVEGIEPSSWAVKVANKKYNLSLIKGSFEDASLKKNFYSVVTMIDYIEHIPFPFKSLRKAYDILRPGGTLCLVTPNINSFAAKITGSKWWHFRPGHLAYFNRKSITAILQRAGFTILLNKNYSWTFSVFYILSRKKYFKIFLKHSFLTSIWRRIPIKLTLGDSMEIYARKGKSP